MTRSYALIIAVLAATLTRAQGDTCTTALPVTSGLHHADGPTTGWPGPGGCGGSGNNGDWYAYVATFTGTINITSCNALNNNTDDDTYVRVYTGSCGALTCVGFNDDMGGNNCPGYIFATYLDVSVTAGQTYYIVWTDMFDSDAFHCNLSECYGTVMGTTYLDQNNNGLRDATEPHAPVVLEVDPGNQLVYAGQDPYSFCTDSGSFTITVPSPPLYHVAVPASRSYSVNNLGDLVTGMDFGFQPIPGIYDGTVSIWGWSPWIGNNTTYHISYNNVGAGPLNGSVVLTLHPLTTFVSSTPPQDSISGQVVYWDLVNLQPGTGGTIHVTYHTDSTALTTDTVTATVYLNTDHLDQTPLDNSDAITADPTTSFDPNEKLVDTERVTLNEVAMGRALEYTVHFQNTGTMPAVNVRVRDIIDGDLDLSTFEMVGATHDHHVQFIGNEVIWTFPQIMLPDSASDPEGSKGGFQFRIAPKTSSLPGTQFENSVGIIFDYNQPVITNTVLTEVTVETLLPEHGTGMGMTLFPSPGDGRVSLLWSRPDMPDARIEVVDLAGRSALHLAGIGLRQGTPYPLDLSGLTAGTYLVRVLGLQDAATARMVVRR